MRLTRLLLETGTLTSGEARHYRSWEYPSRPRLFPLPVPGDAALHRRQKVHAPPIGGRRGLRLLLHALRPR